MRSGTIRGIKYTFWQDGDYYLGFLNEYPEYWTQGSSREDLLENLMGLLRDLQSEWFTEKSLERNRETSACLNTS